MTCASLILSLDFELLWGVRDMAPRGGPYDANLLGGRGAIPRLLELFTRHELAATWATVGLLSAGSREEQRASWPTLRPTYADPGLDPYGEEVGRDEGDDPLVYARSLLKLIRSAPRQEIGSHTFSHFYCQEPGQTLEQFRADLNAHVAVAEGCLSSLVFPRNQVNPAYLGCLQELGFTAYRGLDPSWLENPRVARWPRLQRVLRYLDSYLPLSGPKLTTWAEVRASGRPRNLPSSHFLRPSRGLAWLDELQVARVQRAMTRAARQGSLYHLWWHPHNFGAHTDENFRMLERILDCYQGLRSRYGMRSLTMQEAAELADE